MRRFFLGVLIVVLTTVLTVLLGLGLASREQANRPPEPEIPVSEPLPVVSEEPEESCTAETSPKRTAIAEVPSYFQTDYPFIPYGNGTIATSGCSMTCLAMMATYMTDQVYTPDIMAHLFGSYGKNNIERLDYGISEMQLPYERISNVQEVFHALERGGKAIVMMDDESVFTTAQHFIVLAGMTEDGRILVNDPIEANYTATVYLENGFANGFGKHDIITGFSGAWTFHKEDMPEDYRYDAELPQPQQENRYQGYVLSEEDIYLLASFAAAQDASAEERTQQAFLEVILNRVVSQSYPNTVREVIYETELHKQTEKMQRVEPSLKEYRAVTAAMYGPYILPETVCFFSVWETRGTPWGTLEDYTFFYS